MVIGLRFDFFKNPETKEPVLSRFYLKSCSEIKEDDYSYYLLST